jgi:hypothetical protein
MTLVYFGLAWLAGIALAGWSPPPRPGATGAAGPGRPATVAQGTRSAPGRRLCPGAAGRRCPLAVGRAPHRAQ